MNEPSDDTTEPDGDARGGRGGPPADPRRRRPGAYYYDDATGYEIYDPASEEEDEDEGRDPRG